MKNIYNRTFIRKKNLYYSEANARIYKSLQCAVSDVQPRLKLTGHAKKPKIWTRVRGKELSKETDLKTNGMLK